MSFSKISLCGVLLSTLLVVGCERTIQGYTVNQMQRLKSFRATVADIHTRSNGISVVSITLKRNDNRKIAILEVPADEKAFDLSNYLKKGENYQFPQVIDDFEQRWKNKIRHEDIKQ